MNKQEILNGLWKITKEKQNECKVQIEAIGKDRPTERGIIQLKAGIYNVATAAGLYNCSDLALDLMSKRFKSLVRFFPEISEYYKNLSEEEKGRLEIALHPEMFMRLSFYNTYSKDLAEAQKYGDPQKIFKAKIKKEVLDEILNMWRNFRVENDLFPFVFDERKDENE